MTEKTSVEIWMEETLKIHTPYETVEKLRLTGWSEADILNLLKKFNIQEIPVKKKVLTSFPDIKNPSGKNKITVLGKEYRILFESKLPRAVLIEDFVTELECLELINRAKERISRSTVMDSAQPGSQISQSRTSQGMFYTKEEFEVLADIEKRIEVLTDWPLENQEAMQILNYGIGAEYVAHNDYFDEKSPGSTEVLTRGGNRIGTAIIYLNDVDSGGGTHFPESTIEVKPKARSLLFFGYPTANAESKTLHAGLPVIEGEKWIAVKWIRESRFS